MVAGIFKGFSLGRSWRRTATDEGEITETNDPSSALQLCCRTCRGTFPPRGRLITQPAFCVPYCALNLDTLLTPLIFARLLFRWVS